MVKDFSWKGFNFFLLSFLSNVIVSKETQRVLKIPNGLLIEDYCQLFLINWKALVGFYSNIDFNPTVNISQAAGC